MRQAAQDHKQAKRDAARSKDELLQFDTSQHVPDRERSLPSGAVVTTAGGSSGKPMSKGSNSKMTKSGSGVGMRPRRFPIRYEQEVAEADHLADDRQEKAELVARREQIAAEVARHENRLTEAKEELANCQAARDRLDQSWRELWSACHLSPKSPDTMIEWLRLHAQLSEKLQNRLALDTRRQQVQRRLSAFEKELQKALDIEGQPDDLLEEAGQRAQQARDASLQITRLERELPARDQELEQLRQEREEVGRQQELWRRTVARPLEGTRLSSGMGYPLDDQGSVGIGQCPGETPVCSGPRNTDRPDDSDRNRF